MNLIEDSGKVAHVEINGREWCISSQEYRIMTTKSFHFWPYNLKEINPQEHSCASCHYRPIDFSYDSQRTAPDREPGQPPHRCKTGAWSRAAPFYNNLVCKGGRWN